MNKRDSWKRLVLQGLLLMALVIGWGTVAPPVVRAAEPPTTQELEDMFAQAVLLVQYGQDAEAERLCRAILKYRPDQPTVTALLQKIESRKPKVDPREVLRQRMEKTIIPSVDFNKAVVADVFQLFSQQSAKFSPDKQQVNFLLYIPEEIKVPTLTMNVKNTSLLDLVKYATTLSQLRFYIDSSAVLIYHESRKPNIIPDEPKQADVQP